MLDLLVPAEKLFQKHESSLSLFLVCGFFFLFSLFFFLALLFGYEPAWCSVRLGVTEGLRTLLWCRKQSLGNVGSELPIVYLRERIPHGGTVHLMGGMSIESQISLNSRRAQTLQKLQCNFLFFFYVTDEFAYFFREIFRKFRVQ